MRAFTIDAMMAMIREDLDLLAVHHDLFSSERALVSEGRNRVAEAIEDLRSRGLIYEGRLAPPKASFPRIGKTASRPCSARPISATTSIAR